MRLAWFIALPTLQFSEDAAATEVNEITQEVMEEEEEDVCSYLCQGGGGCTVTYTGPPRPGQTSGSCFSQAFGGSCSGTPAECRDCNEVGQLQAPVLRAVQSQLSCFKALDCEKQKIEISKQEDSNRTGFLGDGFSN